MATIFSVLLNTWLTAPAGFSHVQGKNFKVIRVHFPSRIVKFFGVIFRTAIDLGPSKNYPPARSLEIFYEWCNLLFGLKPVFWA